MTTAMRRKMGMLVGATLLLSACAGLGPTTISRDRFDYTAAISDSWKHQMLFNMVKIRYGDAPVFMDVTSVISQYQVAGLINLGGTISSNPWGHSETLGATGQYVDRPTISFTPILGDKFARSLMAPIPPPAILSLMQAGYPVDLVFRMLVQEINGIRNRFGGEARARSADPAFYVLLEKMRKIQSDGAVGMRVQRKERRKKPPCWFSGGSGIRRWRHCPWKFGRCWAWTPRPARSTWCMGPFPGMTRRSRSRRGRSWRFSSICPRTSRSLPPTWRSSG